MRILLGPVDICCMLRIFAEGFRKLGHQVTIAVSQRLDWCEEYGDDIVDLRPGKFDSGTIDNLIANHDVFFMVWTNPFGFRRLRELGKHIISYLVGSDVRHHSGYEQQYGASWKHNSESYSKDPLVRPLSYIRKAELYSDVVLSCPTQGSLGIRPYMRAFVPVKLSRYEYNIPRRDVPVIIHAPSVKSAKGTPLILPVLERLRSEGIDFDLRLLHGVSQRQVLDELAKADMAIDQLYGNFHGLFSLEALASGCALATSNNENFEPFPPNRPILNIEPGNLYEPLKRLLTDKDLRIRLAQEGRKYVEKYYDHVNVAGRILECLEADEIEYDHYPAFFSRYYRLPQGESIPDELKRMTAETIQRWGLPEDADPQDMIARGLMSADELDPSKPIPRWKGIKASEQNRLPARLSDAEKAASGGNLPQARTILESLIADYPGSDLVRAKLASAAMSQGDDQTAQAQLEKAVESAPRDPRFHSQLGTVYFQRAKQSFQQVLSAEPTNPNALMTLATIARVQGNYKEADQLYNKVVQTYPNYLDGWIAYGRFAMEVGDFKGARALFQQALALSPNRMNIQNYLNLLNKNSMGGRNEGDHA